MKIEIKNAPTSEIDWSKGSQLVIGNRSVIVLTCTNKGRYSELFSGIVIAPGQTPRIVGEYSNDWVKNAFQPFNGEVTLKND